MTKVIQKIVKTPMVVTMVVLMTIAAVATTLSPYSTTEDTYAKNPGASTDDLKVKQCVQEEIDGSPPGSLCGPRERSIDEDDDDDVDEISDERLEAISVPLPPPS
jgi:hypothetical protein